MYKDEEIKFEIRSDIDGAWYLISSTPNYKLEAAKKKLAELRKHDPSSTYKIFKTTFIREELVD